MNAFATPTVVHFCAALLVSAILSAPWAALSRASLLIGLTGLAGVGYGFIIIRRARGQTDYRPVLEDWLWHTIFPLGAYVTLVVAAPLLPRDATSALFAIGAATVVLLFIGIRNSWDTVTYVALLQRQSRDGTPP